MTKLLLVLTSLLLLASVGLNIYLIQEKIENIVQEAPAISQSRPSKPTTEEAQEPEYSSQYKLADEHFSQGEFELAINAYVELIESTTPQEAELIKTLWLERAEQWLEESNIAVLKDFEQQFLKRFPDDIDFLLIEAKRLTLTESVLDGAIAYYRLQDLPLSDKHAEEVEQQLNDITLPNLEKLMQSEAWDIVERFAEPLLQFEPDNERFILILAEAYAQRQEARLMEQTFSRITYREDLDNEFRRIRSIIRYNRPTNRKKTQTEEPRRSQGIALVQTGSHYIVKAFLDNRSELDLLIDTGASTTAITQQQFRKLYRKHRPELIGKFPINTANGQVNARIFRFDSLSIGNFQVNNFAVIVLPRRSNLDSDGLLGMNFLRHYDFRIDQRSSQLFLRNR
ncbi:hypothetical protein EYS14_10005 [Alteromonadaceae bacterium M269]|nr:hypothetical protein EYS14_10005 [Alteromonadaceae bacterium M269]